MSRVRAVVPVAPADARPGDILVLHSRYSWAATRHGLAKRSSGRMHFKLRRELQRSLDDQAYSLDTLDAAAVRRLMGFLGEQGIPFRVLR